MLVGIDRWFGGDVLGGLCVSDGLGVGTVPDTVRECVDDVLWCGLGLILSDLLVDL